MLGSSRGRKAPKKAMDFMPSLRHKAANMDNNMKRKKGRSKSPAKERIFEEVMICLSYFLQTKTPNCHSSLYSNS